MVSAPIIFAIGLGVCLVLEWLVLCLVQQPAMLVQPNERSSHEVPTPTMGGVAIVLVILGYFVWFADTDVRLALGIGAPLLAVAIVGLWDDLSPVSARLRILVHIASVATVLWSLGVLTDSATHWLMVGAVVLAMVWLINLYNFMDGIDGIAAVQCLVFCLGAQWVSVGVAGWSGDVLWLLAGASLAFAAFNWPPAKIFMGDVGSGFLGLLLGSLAVVLWRSDELPLISILILLSAFWFDATYTLCVRILTKQAFTQAHRLHLYQYASRRFGHFRTTLTLLGFAVVWLVPWASFVVDSGPAGQTLALIATMLPIAWACWYMGAGLPEEIIKN